MLPIFFSVSFVSHKKKTKRCLHPFFCPVLIRLKTMYGIVCVSEEEEYIAKKKLSTQSLHISELFSHNCMYEMNAFIWDEMDGNSYSKRIWCTQKSR